MPASPTPALDFILNLADRSSAGLLVLAGSRVIASPSSASSARIIRANTRLARVRACLPNLAGERAFDDVNLSTATVRLAIGKPGENPYCLATLATPFPSAASAISAVQSATVDLPATKRITLDPAPYAGTWLLTLDDNDPIELPWDAEQGQLKSLAGTAYSTRRVAANAWEISGTEPAQDVIIAVDVTGLLVPVGLSGEIELNTVPLAAAFTTAGNPKFLRLSREVTIDGEPVFQDDKLELAREILNLSSLVPAPIPPSDFATLSAAIDGKQPINSGLTAIAALATTAWGRALLTLADAGALRTYASLQPLSAQLTAIAALAGAVYGRLLLTASNAAAARGMLALDQIDNTSDVNKPVSTAQGAADTAVANAAAAATALKADDTATVHNTGPESIDGIKTFSSPPVVPSASFPQSAIQNLLSDLGFLTSDLATKAPLLSPALSGTPTAPTPVNATSSTQLATTAFVHALFTDLLNAPPATLDTLKELADAIGDDPNFAVTVANSVATKLAKASNLSDLTDAAAARTNLGLGNVDNTTDANKPVSLAQAAADTIISAALATHAARTDNPHAVTKSQVGLANVDNTSDANKPVSAAQQAALDLKAALAGNNTFTGQNIFNLLQTFNALTAYNVNVTQLSAPAAPTVTPIGADEGVTRSYKITAVLSDGTTETDAGPAGTTTHSDETLDAINKVSLAWTAVPGAASYNVYRLANDGISPATIGKIANVPTNAYVDTGAAGDGAIPPATNATGGLNGVPIHPKATSPRVLYASKIGAKLDSNVLTGGGTDDTAALNSSLSTLNSLGGGELVIDGPALISAPLLPGSNTTIRCLNDNCGVFLAAGSNCHMIKNAGYALNTNPVEPISGDRQKNISVIGGTWNGNGTNQTKFVANGGGNTWVCGFWLNGVDYLRIEKVTFINPKTFALMITYPDNPTVEHLTHLQTTLDGGANNDTVHLWGPATGQITLRDIKAFNANDTVIALNYSESYFTYPGAVWPAGRVAAVSTLVDGVYAENCTAIARVDGLSGGGGHTGDITIRNLRAILKNANSYAISIDALGKWHRLLCENWTVTLDPATPESYLGTTIPKGWSLTNPQGGSTTELRNIRYTGDSSISATSSPNNAFLTVLPISGGHAAEIILTGIYATKPTASLSGSFFYLANPGSTPLAIDAIQITNCAISGYAYLYGSDAPTGVATWLYLAANSLFDGAQFITGNLPTAVTGTDGNAPQLGGITRFSPSNSFIPGSKNLEVGYYGAGDTGIIQAVDRTAGAVYKPVQLDFSVLNIMPNAHGITNIDGPIDLPERASPGPPGAGMVRLYVNATDHKFHGIDAAGVDHALW